MRSGAKESFACFFLSVAMKFSTLSISMKRNCYFLKFLRYAKLSIRRRMRKANKILSAIIKALCDDPYAIFTFLFLFPYVYKTKTEIESYDVKPEIFSEDLYLLANDTKLLNDLAVTFDII